MLDDQTQLGGRQCRMRSERILDTIHIRLYGEFDLSCEEAFQEELGRILDSQTASLILDLRELEFMDSTGLRVLVSLQNLAREDGFTYTVLCGGDGLVRQVLKETGLDGVLPVVDSSGVVPASDSPV